MQIAACQEFEANSFILFCKFVLDESEWKLHVSSNALVMFGTCLQKSESLFGLMDDT